MGDSFTIQISRDLVKQLADEGEKTRRKTKRSKPRTQREPQNKANQKPVSAGTETPKGTTPVGWPVQPPLFLAVPPQFTNAELDAIRSTVQESERVLEKLQKQEKVMLEEVTQKAKDLHEKEFKLPNQRPPPCLVEKDACFNCYKDNVKDPLKCANVVTSFADCVRRDRQRLSAEKQSA